MSTHWHSHSFSKAVNGGQIYADEWFAGGVETPSADTETADSAA